MNNMYRTVNTVYSIPYIYCIYTEYRTTSTYVVVRMDNYKYHGISDRIAYNILTEVHPPYPSIYYNHAD